MSENEANQANQANQANYNDYNDYLESRNKRATYQKINKDKKEVYSHIYFYNLGLAIGTFLLAYKTYTIFTKPINKN